MSHAHFSDTISLRGVQPSRARLEVFAVRMSHLSISPSPFSSSTVFAVPALSLRHLVPVCTFLAELFRSESAGHAHFRTSGEEFGYLADPTHSTGYEPKEFDKISSADGNTTPVNDPNYDNIFDTPKNTRENIGLFGVSTMLEASVSHVSHGESKDSMHRETVA